MGGLLAGVPFHHPSSFVLRNHAATTHPLLRNSIELVFRKILPLSQVLLLTLTWVPHNVLSGADNYC